MNPLSDTSDTPAGVPGSTTVFCGWWRSSGEVQKHTEGNRSFVIVSQTLTSVRRNYSCDVAFRLSEEPGLQINRGAGESPFVLLSRHRHHHHHHHSPLVFYDQCFKIPCFINAVLFKSACDWEASSLLSQVINNLWFWWSTPRMHCDFQHSRPENGCDWLCKAESTCWWMSGFCHHLFFSKAASTISAHKMDVVFTQNNPNRLSHICCK